MTASDMLADRLHEHVEALASAPRVPGFRQHRFAKNYVADWLKYAGCTVWRERFQEMGSVGYNVMGRVPSQRECAPILIIGAHYDSTAESPAASYAGGLAVMLELASTLTQRLRQSKKCHVQFAAYDRGASAAVAGYGGCCAHARAMSAGSCIVCCVLLMDAVGHVGHFVEVVARSRDHALLRQVGQELWSAGLPTQMLAVIGRETDPPPSVQRSGAGAFWEYAMPAAVVTDTAEYRNPHYSKSLDTPRGLDYNFMTHVTQGLAAAIRCITGVK